MRVLGRSFWAATLATATLAAGAAQRFEPFVPIGVWYDALDRPAAVVLHDLQTIRALGFNHVTVPVRWAVTEPERGDFRLDRVEQVLTLAGESGLKVIVQPDTAAAPPWVNARAPDLGLLAAFVDALTTRAAAHPSVLALDRRMPAVRLPVPPTLAPGASAAGRVWRLDAIRSAAGEPGWLAELEATPGSTAADLRQWAWATLAHGARGVTFVSWYAQPSSDGLSGPDGAVTDRARAAGEFAGVVSRNAALFAPLRPRPSPIAIVYNPFWSVANIAADAIAQRTMHELYERVFERNLQADFISSAEIAGGGAPSYPAALVPFPAMLPRPVSVALEQSIAAGERLLAGPRTVLPTARGLESDIRLDGSGGVVQARFLQSAEALTMIALNYGETARTATFHFSPDTPEAIWQNMETGSSVSFVQGVAGLTYAHTFPPRSTLVLSIRTRLK